ncbi:MAG: hypothetical protein ACJ8R9_21820 [Steroidobacteraceae bacterium]
MKALHVFSAVGLAALAGCATNSGVVPIGNGNYEITGSSATALPSGGSQKMKLLKTANQYCATQGKQVTLVNAQSTDGRVGSAASANGSAYAPGAGASFNAQAVHPGSAANADVIFRCE